MRKAIPAKIRAGLEVSELELNNWAYFLLLMGKWKSATPMAALATDMVRYPRNLDTLGWAMYFEGNSERAIELLSESLEKHDEKSGIEAWAEVAYHKLYVLVDSQEKKHAQELLKTMTNRAPGASWTNRAQHLQALFKVEDTEQERVEAMRSSNSFAYDVAISFAGEDRSYAQELSERLYKRGVRVFYDEYQKADLWGKNLYDYLTDIYEKRARFCVILVSENYASKRWTKLERQAAQARAFQDEPDYILPVRLDSARIPGLLDTVGYLDWNREGLESIVECIVMKLKGCE